MAKYINNLREHGMQTIMISAGLPSDDRVVHVYDIDNSNNLPICAPARYKLGKWIGALTGDTLEGLSDKACWGEAVLFTQQASGTIRNDTEKSHPVVILF